MARYSHRPSSFHHSRECVVNGRAQDLLLRGDATETSHLALSLCLRPSARAALALRSLSHVLRASRGSCSSSTLAFLIVSLYSQQQSEDSPTAWPPTPAEREGHL